LGRPADAPDVDGPDADWGRGMTKIFSAGRSARAPRTNTTPGRVAPVDRDGAQRHARRPHAPAGVTDSAAVVLQRAIGNNAVAQLAGRSPRGKGTHTNPVSLLTSMSTPDLCDLYLSTVDIEFVTERDAFTRAWLSGAGGPVVLREIEQRLDALVESGGKAELTRLAGMLEMARDGEATRRNRLLTMVRSRIPKVLRPGDRFLSAQERSELRILTGNDIDKAFAAFLAACGDHKDALKAAAKAEAEVIALVIDVLTGFLAPAVGRALGGLAGRLPLSASPSLTYLRVLNLVENLLENTDATKAIFTGVMKTAGTTLKVKATALFGEGEADLFLTQLADWQQQQAHDLDAQLPHLSDEELVVIAAAHLPEVSNASAYRERIGNLLTAFRSEVEPIGSTASTEVSSTSSLVAWVRGRGTRRLALISHVAAAFVSDYHFIRWISPEMRDLALAKGGTVDEIAADDVSGLPLLWDLGPIPSP
jgi:hypothetical protein